MVNPCHDGTCDGAQRYECAAAGSCLRNVPEKLALVKQKKDETAAEEKKVLREKILKRIEAEFNDNATQTEHGDVISTEVAISIIYGVFGYERPEEVNVKIQEDPCNGSGIADWITGGTKDEKQERKPA